MFLQRGLRPRPLFVAPGKLKSFVTKELLEGPLKAIDYLDGDGIVRGYAAVLGQSVIPIGGI